MRTAVIRLLEDLTFVQESNQVYKISRAGSRSIHFKTTPLASTQQYFEKNPQASLLFSKLIKGFLRGMPKGLGESTNIEVEDLPGNHTHKQESHFKITFY